MPQAAKLPGTSDLFNKKHVTFKKKFCPGQRNCPGQVVSSNKTRFSGEQKLPQAAELPRTRGFFKQKVNFLEKVLPQAAQLPRTGEFFKKKRLIFWKRFCPRQRSCPGQVTSSKETSIFWKKFFPRQRSYPGQVARSRGRDQPLQPRARSAFLGGPGGGHPRKAGGCGGRSPLASRSPNSSHNLFSNSRSTALAASM